MKGTGIVSCNPDTVMGMGRELGKKNCRRLPAKKKLRIASESENVLARIFGKFFRFPGLPKISFFQMDIQIIMTLTPSTVFRC